MDSLKRCLGIKTPNRFAHGFALSAFVGLTTLYAAHTLLILLLVIIFRFSIAGFLIGFGIFSVLALGLESALSEIGLFILTTESLIDIWEAFYQTALGRWSLFNNTLVMGGLIVSCVIYWPTTLLVRKMLGKWLEHAS